MQGGKVDSSEQQRLLAEAQQRRAQEQADLRFAQLIAQEEIRASAPPLFETGFRYGDPGGGRGSGRGSGRGRGGRDYEDLEDRPRRGRGGRAGHRGGERSFAQQSHHGTGNDQQRYQQSTPTLFAPPMPVPAPMMHPAAEWVGLPPTIPMMAPVPLPAIEDGAGHPDARTERGGRGGGRDRGSRGRDGEQGRGKRGDRGGRQRSGYGDGRHQPLGSAEGAAVEDSGLGESQKRNGGREGRGGRGGRGGGRGGKKQYSQAQPDTFTPSAVQTSVVTALLPSAAAPPEVITLTSGVAVSVPTASNTKSQPYVVRRAVRDYDWDRPFHLSDIRPNSSVLMVAEKPSIANSIAEILSHRRHNTGRGASPGIPVHTFNATFFNKPASFTVTSVIGHVLSCDFYQEFQNWDTTDPRTLFDAPVRRDEANAGAHVCKHLQKEAKGMDYLVLWLDCDREGENICFEVMDHTMPWMSHMRGRQVFRAKFSAITAPDIERAMSNLGMPNEAEALAVDARQELDLKVGVAFTRFQTRYFQGKYGDLDSALISYGPCQTPTLGFCVARFDEIQSFEPKRFWTLLAHIDSPGGRINASWERGRVFSLDAAKEVKNRIANLKVAKLVSCDVKDGVKQKPEPLNTVGLLKICSQQLHIGPQNAMHIAERLYIQGYISYPRTESTHYPEHFDLIGTLSAQRSHPNWGEYVQSLLALGLEKPKAGHDAGDHPPITPMQSASERELGGDDWRIYEYVTRHFIATVSPNCKYVKTNARFDICGEIFKCSGKKATKPGFTLVMPWLAIQDKVLSGVEKVGAELQLTEIKMEDGMTSPPDYLSESELITLMEKHGIGTDASIPLHINNICERNFVQVQGMSRTLVPTKLGIALVHGYHKINSELVLPTVRANIEKQIGAIAKGQAAFETVLTAALNSLAVQFDNFVASIAKMDELFEAAFTKIESTESSSLRARCGKCRRYMKFIPLKPTRLYCPICEETYSLPQGGKIMLYQEKTCPLDGFELLLFSLGPNAKTFSLCPHCYSKPTLEGQLVGGGCNQCPHPTCPQSLNKLGVGDCPKCDEGTLVLDPRSGPKWRLACNGCNFLLHMVEGAHKVGVADSDCVHCESAQLVVDFNKNSVPAVLGTQTKYTACIFCDELLSSLTSEGKSRLRHPMYSRGGGRGRRGRGKRSGRGRDRGGP